MRYTTGIIVAVLGVSLLVAGASVQAHHAFAAEFDANRPVALEGTITKMEWINPHAWMHLDVENEDGTVDSWMIEAGVVERLSDSRYGSAGRRVSGDRRCLPGKRS